MGSISEPLLPKPRQDPVDRGGEDDVSYGEAVVRHDPEGSSRVWTEVRKQFDLAGAMVLANLAQYSITIISTMFVGHLGELQLSSAALATTFGSVTGFTVLTGLSSALETLCGQAYGAKNYHLLSVYLQAGIFVLVIACIPISIVWWNMETVLLLLGQDPEISRMAGVYFAWMCPSLYAGAITQPLLKFLQAQSLVLPMMSCCVLTVLIHIPTCYLLVIKLGLGFHAGGLAVSIAYYINLVLLLIYVCSSNKLKKTWHGYTKEAFGAVTIFLKLSIPSAAMICLEYWAFEILIIFAGILPNPQLQVSLLSICLTTGAFSYMVPLGLASAVSTRVSNELGAGYPSEAKFAVKVVVCLAVLIASGIATTQLLVRNLWGRAFSNDYEVVHAVARVMPLMAIAAFLDCVQAVLSGVARGCGWQEAGAWVNLVSYYAIGLPAALLLGYVFQFGALGLWLGFYCGLFLQLSLLIFLTATTNWEKMVWALISLASLFVNSIFNIMYNWATWVHEWLILPARKLRD